MVLHAQIQRKVFNGSVGNQHVLSGIDLHVPAGSITCLYGPSGCGKSTCLRIIAGLDVDYDGAVTLDDFTIQKPTQHIGMVVQTQVAYDWLTVAGNLTFGLRYMNSGQPVGLLRGFFGGTNTALAREEAVRLAKLVGLTESDLSKYPEQISGGMKQRMAFGRALLVRPQILLLDEPFSSLDFESRQALQDTVVRVRDELGMSFVCVSHDPEEVLYLADEVIVVGGAPASVIQRFRPDFPARGTAESRYTNEFQRAKKELRSWLQPTFR